MKTDNNTTTEEMPAEVLTPVEEREVTFGNGTYSAAMYSFYVALQKILKFSAEDSEVIAKQFGSDYGAEMKSSTVKAKVGKADADNRRTLRGIIEKKKASGKTTFDLWFLVDYLETGFKHGLMPTKSTYELRDELKQGIANLLK